jgi:single-stranded-DNA-specific exonuclease
LHAKEVKLLITVDCGTKDLDVIDYAHEQGIDVIITDHHVVPVDHPTNVVAFLNPRFKGSYPFESLAGAGVAFKLLTALMMRWHPTRFTEKAMAFIDLAALGTIADCMPLIGENRVIASLGLEQMKHSHSDGLRLLVE